MKTLILDSATKVLYTALVIDDVIVYESYIAGQNDHAKSIVYEIDLACKKASINLIDIDRVIVGVGPGSYTGVRMAVSVGKMITTMEKNIELYSISTLVLMASGAYGKVCSIIDARRGNCFGCVYDLDKDSYIVDEALALRSDLASISVDCSVNEAEYKVDALKVIKLAKKVEEPRTLVPNYLRDTEAERNLNA